jgi:hypothetical protein
MNSSTATVISNNFSGYFTCKECIFLSFVYEMVSPCTYMNPMACIYGGGILKPASPVFLPELSQVYFLSFLIPVWTMYVCLSVGLSGKTQSITSVRYPVKQTLSLFLSSFSFSSLPFISFFLSLSRSSCSPDRALPLQVWASRGRADEGLVHGQRGRSSDKVGTKSSHYRVRWTAAILLSFTVI